MAPPAKKAKLEAKPSTSRSSASKSSASKSSTPKSSLFASSKGPEPPSTDGTEFIERFKKERLETAPSIMDFKFNKKRVRILSKADTVPPDSKGIAYWMFRDERVQDNWAVLYAQKLALKNEVPLHICFCLLTKFLDATIRHFIFLLKGLREVRKECEELNIQFHMLYGSGAEVMPDFIRKHNLGALVVDFMPVRKHQGWVDQLKKSLPDDIPLCQVDAHNIVPCWEASDKLEYGARTIRPKINNKLKEYLTGFPPVIKHPHSGDLKADDIDWQKCEDQLKVDRSIGEVTWVVPGYSGGVATLQDFVNIRLKDFAAKRNDPTYNVASHLSPYLHFGQISAQRCILTVKPLRSKYPESVDSYCEEAIIRRELSDNFCFYNPKYDSIEGTNEWARITLNAHKKDKRPYLYTRDQLDRAKTHDDLWNAAQTQLVVEGKMHGFLRMYWAKKILEWMESPEEALASAIYLNDRYSLDGRDPNGFVGCMWSICGIHDQGWGEREVFGKIRYMNYQGCKRKFDVASFVGRYSGKNSLKQWLTGSA